MQIRLKGLSLAAVLFLVNYFDALASGTVTNPDEAAVRAAIQAGGSVTLAFDGTVKLSAPFHITTNTTVDASGHAVLLDGAAQVQHFISTNGALLRLIHLTLVNGQFLGADGTPTQPGAPGMAGSIFNLGGRLDLISCNFVSNHVAGGNGVAPGIALKPETPSGGAAFGGAIFSSQGQIFATNCLFESNSSVGGTGTADVYYDSGRGGDAYGGAIYVASCPELVLASTTFTNNLAQGGEMGGGRHQYGGGAAYGGAIADGGANIDISDTFIGYNRASAATQFREPIAGNGGGVFHFGGRLRISRSVFASNTANGGPGVELQFNPWIYGNGIGGAIYSQSGDLWLTDSSLFLNQAKGGTVNGACDIACQGGIALAGAIYNFGMLGMTNCTLAENVAAAGSSSWNLEPTLGGAAMGGAIVLGSGASGSLVNVTIAQNLALGGASDHDLVGAELGASIAITNASLALVNTILSCSGLQTNVFGTITDLGHNICSDGNATFTATSSLNNTDPLLAPLASNGGTTPTMALLPNSPAIDAGDDTACPPTDQRGVSRPQGLACDIGAFELQPSISLGWATTGLAQIDYGFRANQSVLLSASTNLVRWTSLGSKVTDAQGHTEFQDTNSLQLPLRFYSIGPQDGH